MEKKKLGKAEVQSNEDSEFEKKKKNPNYCTGCKIVASKLFNIPTCLEHKFCEGCAKNKPTYNSCTICAQYFVKSSKKSTPNPKLCWLCEEQMQNSLNNCKSHAYCNHCYNFLVNNDFGPIEKVSKCSDCSLNFQNLKTQEEEEKTNDSYSLKNPQNSEATPQNLPNVLAKDETKSNLDLKMCSLKNCGVQKEKLLKTPRCVEHEYCKDCIENEKAQPICENCLKYFKSLKPKPKYSKNLCSLCNDPFKYSNDVCTLHFYCKICYEFLGKNDNSHIVLVRKCDDCSSYFNELKLKEQGKVEMIGNENLGLNPPAEINDDENLKKRELESICNEINSKSSAEQHKCLNQIEKLFKIPRCTVHRFCKDCIRNENTNISCADCKKYFKSLKLRTTHSDRLCSLCKELALKSECLCSWHIYCNVCNNFLENNEFDFIIIVTECGQCCTYFQSKLIEKEVKKIEPSGDLNLYSPKSSGQEREIESKVILESLTKLANQSIITEENKSHGPKVNQTREAKANEGTPNKDSIAIPPKDKNYSSDFSSDLSEDLYESNLSYSSKPNHTYNCSACKGQKIKVFKTPRCADHDYCEVCINKKPKILKCEFCTMYFESLTRKLDSSILQCSLCKIPPNSPKIKCKSHSYCKYCYEFLINNEFSHIINVANCQDCCGSIKGIKKQVEKVEDPSSNLQSKDLVDDKISTIPQCSIIFTVNLNEYSKCVMCQGKEYVKAFLCNHNICIVCLVEMCCIQLHEFIKNNQEKNFKNLYKFNYFCTFNGCMQRIEVPTKMIIVHLRKFLNIPFRINKFRDYSYIATPGNFDKLIVYFDGIVRFR